MEFHVVGVHGLDGPKEMYNVHRCLKQNGETFVDNIRRKKKFIKIIATFFRFCPNVTKPGPQCDNLIKIKFIARALISQLQHELQN